MIYIENKPQDYKANALRVPKNSISVSNSISYGRNAWTYHIQFVMDRQLEANLMTDHPLGYVS